MDRIPSDIELIEEALAGSEAAYASLVERHQTMVVRLVHKITRRPDWVEDLAQEVFIKAFDNLHRFEQRSGFATWLYRITVNLCLEAARKESTQRRTLRQALESEALPDSVLLRDPEGGPRLVLDRELQLDVRRALAELKPETRTLLTLRYLEEFTTVEMAELLEWPEGTVRSKLHAARRELAQIFESLQGSLEQSQRKRGK